MTCDDVLTEVTSPNLPRLTYHLNRWYNRNAGWKAFVSCNTQQLKRRIRDCATSDDESDLINELYVGALCASREGWTIGYQPTALANQGRMPDYLVLTPNEGSFYVEATCIRKSGTSTDLDNIDQVLHDVIVSTRTPLRVGVDLGSGLSRPDAPNLQRHLSEVCTWLKEVIEYCAANLADGEVTVRVPQGLDGEIIFTIEKDCSRGDRPTGYMGGSRLVPYTQCEHRQFKRKLDEKLGQLVPGCPNLLAITTRSDTHDEWDCAMACGAIRADSVGRIRHLTAILFVKRWLNDGYPNWVWRNPSAELPMTETLLSFLRDARDVS